MEQGVGARRRSHLLGNAHGLHRGVPQVQFDVVVDVPVVVHVRGLAQKTVEVPHWR